MPQLKEQGKTSSAGMKPKANMSVATQGAREKSHQVIVDAVKNGITTGRFAPGQRLIEADLSEMFGVGRSSVREGLKLLVSEGVVQIEHNRGARVRSFEQGDILALHQVREVLEGLAASLAAKSTKKVQFDKRFRDVLKAQSKAVDQKRPDHWFLSNRQFHDLILEMSGNSYLQELVAKLPLTIFSLQSQMLVVDQNLVTRFAEHEKIVAAIFKGNEKQAELSMRDHIRNSRWFREGR